MKSLKIIHISIVILFFSCTSIYFAQNVEINLKSDDLNSGLLLKDSSGHTLFQVRADGKISNGNITDGNPLFDYLFAVQGVDMFRNPTGRSIGLWAENNEGDDAGDLILNSGGLMNTEWAEGASIKLFGAKTWQTNTVSQGGGIDIVSGDSEQKGGDINIKAGQGLDAGEINIISGYGRTGNPAGNILLYTGGNPYTSSLPIGDITLRSVGGIILDPNYLGVDLDYCSVQILGSGTYSGTWTQASDRRLKKNIQSLNEQSEKVLNLNPVKYEMRRDEYPEKNLADGEQIGLIAQEVDELFPQLVKTDSDGFKSIDYSKVSVLLLDVVKEQNEQLERQNKLLNELVQRIDRIENNNEFSLNN